MGGEERAGGRARSAKKFKALRRRGKTRCFKQHRVCLGTYSIPIWGR